MFEWMAINDAPIPLDDNNLQIAKATDFRTRRISVRAQKQQHR